MARKRGTATRSAAAVPSGATPACDLPGERLPLCERLVRQTYSRRAQLVDDRRHAALPFHVLPRQGPGDIAVVLLPQRFELAQRPPAGPAVPGAGINIKAIVFVPRFLLRRGEDEVSATP